MFNPRFSPRGPLSFKPDDIAPRASTTASKRFLAHQYTTITGAAQALRKLYSVVGSALRWSNKFRLVMKYSKQQYEKADAAIAEGPTPLSPRSRFRAAMILAMAADALQLFVFPLFAEGALSPADDVLDLAVAAALVRLLGWHWEFLPTFVAELVPGVDLVPFWTVAVLNIYRKWKQITIIAEEPRERPPALKG